MPDVLGMLAPRPLTVYGSQDVRLEKVAAVYAAAGAREQLKADRSGAASQRP